MKKTLPLFLLMIILSINACTPLVTATPMPLQATEPVASVEIQTPIAVSPTESDQSVIWKKYTNSAFGLSFQYPTNWFGPDEYVSEQTLRVALGSDIVYPYGTSSEEQIYEIRNSYYVVIQYSKNDQNQYLNDTYQTLVNLQDGESSSGTRSLIIRVRQHDLGGFTGFEYISTLSETAQTEHFYIREVVLFDEQSNHLLTIMGYPNNVEVSNGMEWRDAYQKIDEANLIFFHQIMESLTIE